MKNLTVKELNRDDFPVKDYDNYNLNLDELFKPVLNPTMIELEISQSLMDELRLDSDTQIIEFRATTSILVSYLLNLNRKLAVLKMERE